MYTYVLQFTADMIVLPLVRFLGMTIDKDLNWNTHIDGIISRVNGYGYLLKNLRFRVIRGTFHA